MMVLANNDIINPDPAEFPESVVLESSAKPFLSHWFLDLQTNAGYSFWFKTRGTLMEKRMEALANNDIINPDPAEFPKQSLGMV